MEEVPRFKATEVRQFLLYTGVVLMKQFLTADAYHHFLKLSVAYRLLSQKILKDNVDLAGQLLQEYVEDYTLYYKKEYIRYNIHSLLHVADDVKLHGPLPNYSCYKFEDKIRQLKKMIRSNNRVHQQLFNRIRERQNIGFKPN